MLRNKNTIQLGWQTESIPHQAGDVIGNSTIVVPALNVAARISPVLERLVSSFPNSRILVVDAGSEDGTQSAVMQYVKRSGSLVDLLQRRASAAEGLNATLLEALHRCGTAYMMVVGAHTERPRTLVKSFADSLENGADIVLPSVEDVFPKPLSATLAQSLVKFRLRHWPTQLQNPLALNFAVDVHKLRTAIQRHEVLIDPRLDYFIFDVVKSRRADFSIVESLDADSTTPGTAIDLRTAAALFFS